MNAKLITRNIKARANTRNIMRARHALSRSFARRRAVGIIDGPFTLRWFGLDD